MSVNLDELAKGLASGTVTRRKALALLGASAIGLAFPRIAQAVEDDKCGDYCHYDSDCNKYGSKCKKCDTDKYECVPDDKCGDYCRSDRDCNKYGSKCKKCDTDKYECVPDDKCGDYCHYDSDCNKYGSKCKKCDTDKYECVEEY